MSLNIFDYDRTGNITKVTSYDITSTNVERFLKEAETVSAGEVPTKGSNRDSDKSYLKEDIVASESFYTGRNNSNRVDFVTSQFSKDSHQPAKVSSYIYSED